MRRRLLLGLVLGALVSVPAATAALAAAPGPGGVSLSGDANSSPVETTLLATTVSTTPLIDAQYPHAQADVASNVQATAHGSILDPGALVQTLPYEIDSNCPPPAPFPPVSPPGGCPPFPTYPYGADADSGRPHSAGSVAGGTYGPLTLAAGEYDLNVGQGTASALASGGRAALAAPAPLPALTFTNGSARAEVHVDGAQVVSTVATRLQGVTIAGVLDIGAIDSTVTTTASAGRAGSATGTFAISGVTLAGQAASIDQDGVHLLGQALPLPLDPAQQALDRLQQGGLGIKLLAPSRQVASGHSSYTGSAVELTMTSSQDGSSISVLLGGARSSAVAVRFQAPQLAPLATYSSTSLPPPPGGLPAMGAPSSSIVPGTSGVEIVRLAGFALTATQLLIALAALLELALLAALATILRRPPEMVRQPTLRGL